MSIFARYFSVFLALPFKSGCEQKFKILVWGMESILKNSFQLARHSGILNVTKNILVFRTICGSCRHLLRKPTDSKDGQIEEDPHCEYVKNMYLKSYELSKKRKHDDSPEKPCRGLRMDNNPCKAVPRKSKPKAEKVPFQSMWQPPCTPDEEPFCKDMLPRFDAIYYKPSDRRKNCQRTWAECPRIRERIKKVCCLDAIQPPEVFRRVRETCPKVVCTFDYSRMRHVCLDNTLDPEGKCKKVHMPCCPPARCKTSCKRESRVTKCNRLRTPYPCYSDKLPRRKSPGLTECVRLVSGCEVSRVK